MVRRAVALMACAVLVVAGAGYQPLALGQGVDCCDGEVNLGFSEHPIKDAPPFEGIVGVGELCTGDQGEIISEGAPWVTNTTTVYANIVSNVVGVNVQGWSLGIWVDGTANVVSATTAGTAADIMERGGYRDSNGSFNKTQVIDPTKYGGIKAACTAVALTTQGLEAAAFPPVGTESVLAMRLSSAEPQGETEQVAHLSFFDCRLGTGQPVDLVVMVSGNSGRVCNAFEARTSVVFRKCPIPRFLRGNANADGLVDIADAVWILNQLFGSGPPSVCADAADANDSGGLDISDPLYLINYLFLASRAPPPAPGPDLCGPDGTEDDLDCVEVQGSCPDESPACP
jgi:hypothetical protein